MRITRWLLHTALLLGSTQAFGHGDAAWIEAGKYLTSYRVHCCGPEDCKREHAAGTVVILKQTDTEITVLDHAPDGAERTTTLVKYKGWYPSLDQDVWVCRRGTSEPVCLFTPEIGG